MDSPLPLAPHVPSEPAPLRCCCGSEECVVLRHNCEVLDGVEKDVHTAAKLGQVCLFPPCLCVRVGMMGFLFNLLPSGSGDIKRVHLPVALPLFKPCSCHLNALIVIFTSPMHTLNQWPPLTFSLQALLARHESYITDTDRDRADLTTRIAFLESENTRLATLNVEKTAENRSLLDQLESLNTAIAESDGRIHALEASLQASRQSVRRLEIAAGRAADMERHIDGLEKELESAQELLFCSEDEARAAARRYRAAERSATDLQDQLERLEKAAGEEREQQAEAISRLERQRELNSAAVRLKGAAAAKSLGVGPENPGAVSSFVRDLLQDNASLQLGVTELRELLAASRDEIHTLRECLADQENEEGALSLRTELGFPASPPPREAQREVHIHHHYHAAPKERRKKKRGVSGLLPGSATPTPRSPSVVTVSDAPWEPGCFEDSLASSPVSDPRASVFDRMGLEGEPLSPCTSVDPLSPWKSKRALMPPSPSGFTALDSVPVGFLGTDGDTPEVEVSEATDTDTPTENESLAPRPLKRSVSHESIMSLGGLDIHTLHSRPSQLTMGQLGAQAVITDVTAQPTISRAGGTGSSVLSSLAAMPRGPGPTPAGTAGKGGKWWKPWKADKVPAQTSESAEADGTPEEDTEEGSAPRDIAGDPGSKDAGGSKDAVRPKGPVVPKDPVESVAGSVRAPGINQPGAIPGFGEFMAQARRRVPSGGIGGGVGVE